MALGLRISGVGSVAKVWGLIGIMLQSLGHDSALRTLHVNPKA